MRPKIGPCRPGMDPSRHVNVSLSVDIDSEMLQYVIIGIKNGFLGSERGCNFTHFTATCCVTAGYIAFQISGNLPITRFFPSTSLSLRYRGFFECFSRI